MPGPQYVAVSDSMVGKDCCVLLLCDTARRADSTLAPWHTGSTHGVCTAEWASVPWHKKHLQTCARCFLLCSPKFHRKNGLLGPWNDFEVASGWSLVEGAAQGRDRGIHMCCCVISSHRLPPVGISRDPPVQSSSTLLHLGPI